MQIGARTGSFARLQGTPREKGIATLRLFNSADYPFGWIYEEPVIGAYKPPGSESPVIVTSAGIGKPLQLFTVDIKTSYARHMGSMPEGLRAQYDECEPGSYFFVRERRMQRLSVDQVKALAFSLPVWVAARTDRPMPLSLAPPIPIGARMCRVSIFSDGAGRVARLLAPDGVVAAEKSGAGEGAALTDAKPTGDSLPVTGQLFS